MPSKQKQAILTAEFIENTCSMLKEGKPVDYELPFSGRLHIDRQLPFLCVYRDAVGQSDSDTKLLIAGEASYLIASSRAGQNVKTTALIEKVVQTLSEKFGSFLLIELWAGAEVKEDENINPEAIRPEFVIHTKMGKDEKMDRVHEVLRQKLERIKIMKKIAKVSISSTKKIVQGKTYQLLPSSRMAKLNCYYLGLEVQPIYRSHNNNNVFPLVFRALRRGVSRAIQHTCFAFVENKTKSTVKHYQNLGPRAISRQMWEVDSKLAKISSSFDFLLQVTPINIIDGWNSFKRSKFERNPVFHYRPLPIDPAELKKQLYSINLDRVEDPTVDLIFREKRAEIDRQLTMLVDRNTKNFLYGSLQLYGPVSDALKETACLILEKFPPREKSKIVRAGVNAEQFASLVKAEIQRFEKKLSIVNVSVSITEEVASMMVSSGNLLISPTLNISETRAHALIAHEVETHVLTYWNARSQPFKLLSTGLSGYDEFQEGLAVLSEYLAGGLVGSRLRVLAGRVLASRYLEEGATFIENFRKLWQVHNFDQQNAYRIVTRIYRGGGLTKDAVYLRGLIQILDYLKNDGDIKLLLIGKFARRHVPIIQELRRRGVLKAPVLLPNYLTEDQGIERLKDLANKETPMDLVQSE